MLPNLNVTALPGVPRHGLGEVRQLACAAHARPPLSSEQQHQREAIAQRVRPVVERAVKAVQALKGVPTAAKGE